MYDNLFSVELFLCNEHFELHFTHSSIIVFYVNYAARASNSSCLKPVCQSADYLTP